MMDSRMLKKGQDFACKNTEDMYYPELADSVRHFKEKGGRENMCEAVEKYAEERAAEAVEAAKEAMEKAAKKAERETAKKVKEAAIKAAIEDAVSYGMNKTQIVVKVCDKYKKSEAEAIKLYYRYAGN